MKYILIVIISIAILSCEKQENPNQKEADTLNFKKAEKDNLINIEVDSTFIDTVVIKIYE